tara:strand:- start:142 stop:330 length:189 start_codon:yes stop_codon:yes gene_type:complete
MDLESTYEPRLKCTECGETKEVTANYINSLSDEMITVCYDCSRAKYVESLMLVSSIDGLTDT